MVLVALFLGWGASLVSVEAQVARTRLPSGYERIEHDGWSWAIRKGSEPPNEILTKRVAKRLATIRARLSRPGLRPPVLVRTPNRNEFRRVTVELGGGEPASWVAALAFSTRGIVVLDAQRLEAQPLQRTEIIAHELAHVVMGEVGPRLPRWYHEGVAQWLAGEQIKPEWRRLLSRYAADESLYRFAEIQNFPPESQRGTSIFYAQAHVFVLSINERFGEGVHAAILDRVAAGASFEDAFTAASGVTLESSEQQWWDVLAAQHSWLSFAVGGVSFFQIVAFLAIIAFLIERSRRRRTLARMAAEEEREAAAFREAGDPDGRLE